MMRRTGFITMLLVFFLSVPVFAADNGGSSGGMSGGMMGGGMMGGGMMGQNHISMGMMKEHHKMMGDMMGMIKETMVILERSPGVKEADREELKKMIVRMEDIVRKHRGMMKDMKKMKMKDMK